ncbi:hypothetical protein CP061683_0702B, partial [Chlamydia psittaci 06-1683]
NTGGVLSISERAMLD